MDLRQLSEATLEWSRDRGILQNGKAVTQTLKLVSEVGELADNLIKGKDTKDDIGDILVLLCNIAYLTDTTLKESWSIAYDDIKDRKGFLNGQGNFIKDTTPGYEELYAEFLKSQEL